MSSLETQIENLTNVVSTLVTVTEKNTLDIGQIQTSIQGLVAVVTQQQTNQEQQQRNFETVILELQRQGSDIREMQGEIREMQGEIRELRVDVREIQAEVRGLQTENRRILDHLINSEDS